MNIKESTAASQAMTLVRAFGVTLVLGAVLIYALIDSGVINIDIDLPISFFS